MSVVFGFIVIAAVTADLVCLITSHRIAAVLAALTAVVAFILANAQIPDSDASATSGQSRSQLETSRGYGDNQCR
jgi:hypothetical protein